MFKWVMLFMIAFYIAGYGQNDAHLDPSNWPDAMKCDPSAELLQAYEDYYRGDRTYNIRTSPPDPTTGSDPVTDPQKYYAPIIDGSLEDNIWFYADTLLINSWEDADASNACVDNPDFYGPQDLHGIWRFCYNHDGLYVSCEVHDDIHDVDSLKGWSSQDGVELGVDPWDWGDKAAGLWEDEVGKNTFRRYFGNNRNVLVKPDNAHLCYVHLLKRMNDEPYIAGMLYAKHLAEYGRGDEASNHRLADTKANLGFEFAIQYHGVDRWFREIHHAEFKFPYHTAMWQTLDDAGGYYDQNGLPLAGTLFKFEIKNNDDDMLGPDGSSGNTVQISRMYRGVPFWQEETGHDHWSDTKYYMTFKYNGPSQQEVVHINTGSQEHGDPRLAGVWVDAATESDRYNFTGGGTVKLQGTAYFYDVTTGNNGSITDNSGNEVATYTLKETGSQFKDTLFVTMGTTNLSLLRYLATGFNQVEGRWVEAKLDSFYDARCDTTYYQYVPRPNAREFRFCPLSRIDTSMAGNDAYKGVADSLRIFNYANDSLMDRYTYTYEAAILGRDVTYFNYEIVKLIDPEQTAAPRNMIIKYASDNSLDTLVQIKTFTLSSFGETGNNRNMKIKMYPNSDSASQVYDFIWIWNKYKHQIFGYFDSTYSILGTNYNRIFISFYPDMVMGVDSSKGDMFWNKIAGCEITQDSLLLVNYDPVAKTADNAVAKEDTTVFPDSSWVLQINQVLVTTMVGAEPVTDTFTFKDTTQIAWHQGERPEGVFNLIQPYCIGIEDVVNTPTKTLLSKNYPNPFNPTTVIQFNIPARFAGKRFDLKVFNVRGQLVRTLIKGKVRKRGINRKIVWHGMDNTGKMIGSGVYYYRLTVGNQVRKGNLVMVK